MTPQTGLLLTLLSLALDSAIYTTCGPSLLALNPWRPLPLYGTEQLQRCRDHAASSAATPPAHIFAVAAAALRLVATEGSEQTVVVSGESGAGKTETSRRLLQALAACTAPVETAEGGVGGGGGSALLPLLLQAVALVEPFGSAATALNPHSSRFGRLLSLSLAPASSTSPADLGMRAVGGQLTCFLLERSRVTAVPPGERSFHVYYQLLHAPSEEARRELRLQGGGTPQDYKYLRRGARLAAAEADGIGQARLRLTEAFDALGLSPIEAAAMRLVSAALCLGNVAFQSAAGPGEQGEGSAVAEPPPLDAVAALLGLEAAPLETALCTRVMVTRGERIELGLSAAQAAQQRDSLASYLHCQLFEQLVQYANQTLAAAALDCAEAAGAAGAGAAEVARRVGVVDMFGFEQFETNSFEQLCINFANEKLQAQYLGLVLRLEQAEYEREGITWSPLASLHTDGPLRLIEDPAGLIALLDEQCRLGERGSDDGSNPNPNPNPSPQPTP